jgi:hypothetical protein
MRKASKRFDPTPWVNFLVPALLILLLLVLLAAFVIVGLSLAGVTPG